MLCILKQQGSKTARAKQQDRKGARPQEQELNSIAPQQSNLKHSWKTAKGLKKICYALNKAVIAAGQC